MGSPAHAWVRRDDGLTWVYPFRCIAAASGWTPPDMERGAGPAIGAGEGQVGVSRGIGHEAGRQVTPEQVAELLAETDLFGVLDAAALAEVAERTRVKVVEKGQTIFVQDEPGDRLFVVAKGAVKLVVRSAQGEVVELVRHWRPAVFGEVALLDGGPRSATAEALEPTTLVVVTRDELIRLLRSDSQIVDQVLKALGGLIRRADQQAIELVFLDLPGRLARRLLELAEAPG